MPRRACRQLGRRLPCVALLLGLMAPVAAPARADMPSQSYLPPAAAPRHVAPMAAPAPAPHRPWVPARTGIVPPRRLPPQDVPLPDRGQQIIDMQLAPRGPMPTRVLSPGEATAIWHGYTGRIGKPPGLSGGASGGGTGASGGAGGGQ